MKTILIMFGGESVEHEVSVITGLQVTEKIDRTKYRPVVVYVRKDGVPVYIPNLENRKDFNINKGKAIKFGRDNKGGYIKVDALFGERFYPSVAYLAFHGGTGEGGSFQGLLETLDIPHTSSSTEGAVIAMNKNLTKYVATNAGVEVLPSLSLFSWDIKRDSEKSAKLGAEKLGLPLIVKPAHLGSSIGIKIVQNVVELEKSLIESSNIDKEVLVEKLLNNFKEFNCSVRSKNSEIELSEIERPISKDEILSFADKYQRGGKKNGSGMASLERELPARISPDLETRIKTSSRMAFLACRAKGMLRVDFLYTETDNKLYLSEINTIPGSMAFYLWESKGVSFKEQISDMIEEAIADAVLTRNLKIDYTTDIIDKFIGRS